MKKIIALILTLCFFVSPGFAEFCDPFYAEILGGANFLQTSKRDGIKTHYNTGYIVSGSIGYRWLYGFRLEGEYAFRKNTLRKGNFFGRSFTLHGHFQSSSYMGNLIWDLPSCYFCNIQPFLGGGAGYDFQQFKGKNGGIIIHENKKQFSWQVIAGLGYPIFCNTDLSLEYKFHKGGFKHIYSHSVGVGLTYTFGLNL